MSEPRGQAGRASAAPFPIGSLGWVLVIVGYVGIGKGRLCRHGDGITRVGREGRRQKNALRVTQLNGVL